MTGLLIGKRETISLVILRDLWSKDKMKKILPLLFVVIAIIVAMPVVLACGYTYLCEDDFSFEAGANDMLEEYGSSYNGALKRAGEYYNSNQGTFLFNFLIHFVRAYSRWDLPGLHVYMICVSLLFMIALLMMINAIVRNKEGAIMLYAVVLFMVFGMHGTLPNKELFFWYTGTMNFTLEFIMSFFSCTLLMKFVQSKEEDNSKEWCILIGSSILAFLASGGALNVVAANCAWLFAIEVLYFIQSEKDRFKVSSIIPFGAGLLGAIINVAAPGNYNRSDATKVEGHMTFIDGLRDTFVTCMSEDKMLFTQLSFIIALLLTFGICLFMKLSIMNGKISVPILILVLIGTGGVRFLTMFPVSYGYHSDVIINQRTQASYEIIAKLMYILFVMFLGQWIREKFENREFYRFVPVAITIAVFVIAGIGYGKVKAEIKDSISYAAFDDFRTGAMIDNYVVREYVLSSLRLAEKDSDAIVYVPGFNMANSAYGMGLSNDSEEFRNKSAAGLFDLHTVTLIYGE